MKTARFSLCWGSQGPKPTAILGQLVIDLPSIRRLVPDDHHRYSFALHFDANSVTWGFDIIRLIRKWLKEKHGVVETWVDIDGESLEVFACRSSRATEEALRRWAETLDELKKTRQFFPNKHQQHRRLTLEKRLAEMQENS